MESGVLRIERRGPMAWIEIHRETDRNSINSNLMAELEAVLLDLENSDARAAVFSGAGGTYFIGGADGIEMMRLDRAGAFDFSRRIQGLFDRMQAGRLLTVAAIDGLCFGGGFELAMACDLRVATARSRIGLPEVKVGLIPGGGGTQRLPRLVGLGRALEMILSGRLYGGREAAAMGLIHLAVEDGGLEAGVESLLAPILRQPQYALELAKAAVYGSQAGSLADGLAIERERFSRCLDRDFFRDLMKEQLKSGVLTTTANVADLIGEHKS